MNCPTCQSRTLSGRDHRGNEGRYCPNCARFVESGGGKVAEQESEPEVVENVVGALKRNGYRVLRVGQGDTRRAGSDKGVPDLLVARGSFWVGLEVKTRTGRPTPEQAELASKGLIYIVRSPEEAIEALAAAEGAV